MAEKTDLTTNYIGMVERGEKIPSLETFIKIVNALGVSSDMVLTDVLETGYTVKNSMLNEKLENVLVKLFCNTLLDKYLLVTSLHEFGADDIVKGSGYISSQCCGNTEIELGTVYSSEMGITLLSNIDMI